MSLTGPTPYQATTKNPKYGSIQSKFYYYDSAGNTLYDTSPQNFLNYISGNSYITYAFRAPDYRWATANQTLDSVTFSADIDNLANMLKSIPAGKRGFQPFSFNAFNDRIYYFDEDKVSTPGEPNTTFYLRNWGTTTSSNNYPSLWAAAGVSTQYDYWRSWFTALSAQGATVDAIFMDNEGSVFEGGFFTENRRNAIVNDPRFQNTFLGFTSMADIYYLIGQTSANISSWNDSAWSVVSQFYKAINFTKAYGDSLLSVYPDAVLSDYGAHHGVYYQWIKGRYPSDPNSYVPTDLNYAELFGAPRTQIRQIGNASSPILYGWFRELGYDWGNLFFIRGDDPTIVYFPHNQNPYGYKDAFISTGPWASFIQAMSVLRDAKRGNPNIPLTPWIGSVYMTGDGYVLKNGGFDTSAYYGRAPSVVLNKLWRKEGISSLTKGFTAPDGSTSAFRVRFNAPSTISSVWYKQNAIINPESGVTNSYSITVFGNTGQTSGLAYYVSGLTAGETYTFSYEIDLNRGFTGNLARFTVWSTSDTVSLAPLQPNATTPINSVVGITFNQILPVLGSNSYKEAVINYNVGDSGWTKVSWSFVPQETSTSIGLHVYYVHGLSYLPEGYVTWIRNPSLYNESLGTTFSINQIDNLTYASRTSLSYYSNEILPGSTYIFSYYLNLDQAPGLTYPFVRQRAFDVYPSTYEFALRGTTIQQFEPVVSGSSYGTLPVSISSGSSGWTKFVYKFSKNKLYQDIDENPTIELSLYDRQNHYSVIESNTSSSALSGFTAFVWDPELELEQSPSNINLNVTPLDSEYSMDYMQWRDGPPGGFCDIAKGYDSRTNIFCVERGGNSGYYYELIRHACLHGTKSFGFFNPMSFEDQGDPGSKARGRYNQTNINSYLTSGRTAYLKEFETLNQCLQDAHDKIGGFTLTTGTYERVNWMAPYFVSGAPDITGMTWWWRVTVKPGHTMYINGLTLSSNNPGAWIPTSGPTFSGVTFTITEMSIPVEPNIAAATKDLNYMSMITTSDLISSGTNFSRGSTASYIGASGYLMYAGPNQPRFEYYPDTLQPRGLLLERASTNLLNWSESFANTGGLDNNWIDSNLTRISGVTSPQNITNAIRFVATTGNATLISTNPVMNGATGYRSFSFWARGVTGNEKLYYTIDGGTSWVEVLNLNKNWKRMAYGPFFTGSTIEYPYIKLLNDSIYHTTHVGFKLGSTGQAVELWGAQVEDRTPLWGSINSATPQTRKRATSYISTHGASAGRSADFCSIPGSCGDLWIGNTQGTFIYELEGSNWMTGRITLSGSSASVWCDWQDDSAYQTWSIPGGSITGLPNLGRGAYPTVKYPIDIPVKWGFTYNYKGTKVSACGGLAYQNFTNFSGFGTNKSIGFVGPITGLDSIHVRRIRHWNYVLNDTDFQNLTKGGIDLIKWMNRGDGGNLLGFNGRV